MLGTVALLLIIPIVLWVGCELLARWSAAPWIWSLFGFSLERQSPPERDGRSPGAIGRAPDLPPRLSLHDRSPLPLYDPGKNRPAREDEFEA